MGQTYEQIEKIYRLLASHGPATAYTFMEDHGGADSFPSTLVAMLRSRIMTRYRVISVRFTRSSTTARVSSMTPSAPQPQTAKCSYGVVNPDGFWHHSQGKQPQVHVARTYPIVEGVRAGSPKLASCSLVDVLIVDDDTGLQDVVTDVLSDA